MIRSPSSEALRRLLASPAAAYAALGVTTAMAMVLGAAVVERGTRPVPRLLERPALMEGKTGRLDEPRPLTFDERWSLVPWLGDGPVPAPPPKLSPAANLEAVALSQAATSWPPLGDEPLKPPEVRRPQPRDVCAAHHMRREWRSRWSWRCVR